MCFYGKLIGSGEEPDCILGLCILHLIQAESKYVGGGARAALPHLRFSTQRHLYFDSEGVRTCI